MSTHSTYESKSLTLSKYSTTESYENFSRNGTKELQTTRISTEPTISVHFESPNSKSSPFQIVKTQSVQLSLNGKITKRNPVLDHYQKNSIGNPLKWSGPEITISPKSPNKPSHNEKTGQNRSNIQSSDFIGLQHDPNFDGNKKQKPKLITSKSSIFEENSNWDTDDTTIISRDRTRAFNIVTDDRPFAHSKEPLELATEAMAKSIIQKKPPAESVTSSMYSSSRTYSQRIKPLGKEKTIVRQSKFANGTQIKCQKPVTAIARADTSSIAFNPNIVQKSLTQTINSSVLKEQLSEMNMLNQLGFIESIAKESLQENIFDRDSKEEILSMEPFIILKNSNYLESNSKTNIRAVDIQKIIDLICKYMMIEDKEDEAMRINIMEIFFLTHDLCISAVDLFREILKRFLVPVPAMLSPSERKEYYQKVLKPLQFQILDVLAFWMRTRSDDFMPDGVLMSLLGAFYKYMANDLDEGIKAALELMLPSFGNTLTPKNSNKARTPKNLTSKPIEQVKSHAKTGVPNPLMLLDQGTAVSIHTTYTSDEMAQQMTRIDLEFLSSARVCHLPHNVKNHMVSGSNGFKRMINYTNYLTFYFVHMIIGLSERSRGKLISWLLETAEKLLFLNNFQSFSIIMGALTNVALNNCCHKEIDRKTVTWHRFSTYERLFLDVGRFRKKVSEASCPKIPSIMVVSEDITKLISVFENSFQLETRKLIDLQVMEEIAELIDSLLNPKNHIYNPIECISRLQEILIQEPIKAMRVIDPQLNIAQIQTKLMSIRQQRRTLLDSLF